MLFYGKTIKQLLTGTGKTLILKSGFSLTNPFFIPTADVFSAMQQKQDHVPLFHHKCLDLSLSFLRIMVAKTINVLNYSLFRVLGSTFQEILFLPPVSGSSWQITRHDHDRLRHSEPFAMLVQCGKMGQ